VSMEARRLRVAFYSHDTMGLGHLRRNLLVADALASSPLRPIPLLIAGVREATAFAMPPGTDCLILPALRKSSTGLYEARSLDVSIADIIALRARVIRGALEAFEPDVLIVDNVPRGALRELESALQHLRKAGRTRCVLGLRDVIDEPAAVKIEWSRLDNEDAIRDFYDEVWAYSDPTVYNLVREYRFSEELASKVRFTGYLDQRARFGLFNEDDVCPLAAHGLRAGEYVLCTLGGGQDGASLAEAFALAELPADMAGVILTGPYMPKDFLSRLRWLASANARMQVLEFFAEPAHFMRGAAKVIMMGGYNSACEALSFEKPMLIAPRVKPRQEQMIRAQALRAMGLADLLWPEQLCPDALSRWLSQDQPRPEVHGRIDFNGLSVLTAMFERLASGPTPEVRSGVA
jgi:predicted glycosyltransferase